MTCDFDDEGREFARSIIENAICDAGRGLDYSLRHEGGKRSPHWLGTLTHLLKELRKLT